MGEKAKQESSLSMICPLCFTTEQVYEILRVGLHDKTHLQNLLQQIDNVLCVIEVHSKPQGQLVTPDYLIICTDQKTGQTTADKLSQFKEVQFIDDLQLIPESDVVLELSTERYYEFFDCRMRDGQTEKLEEFLTATRQVRENYGRPAPKSLVQFQVVPSAGDSQHPASSVAGLVEWAHFKDPESLMSQTEFQKFAAEVLSPVVTRTEMVVGRILPPRQGSLKS